MKLNVQGTYTEVKVVNMDVDLTYLKDVVFPHLTMNDVKTVLRMLVLTKFKSEDPTIAHCDPDWYRQKWEEFSYLDYHKNEDIYSVVRPFSQSEKDLLLAIDAIVSAFE